MCACLHVCVLYLCVCVYASLPMARVAKVVWAAFKNSEGRVFVLRVFAGLNSTCKHSKQWEGGFVGAAPTLVLHNYM